MSYNTPKVINVFYKEDRKPYDINGKAISYFGEDFIGSNDATKIRFYLQPNEPLDGITALIHAKRADSEVRFEILTSGSDSLGNYFELILNSWFTMKVGKVTLSLKLYSGDVVFGETEGFITSIESVSDALVIASDIFTFNVGYAPNATEVVPPFIDDQFDQLVFALGEKPDFKETIHVVSELPTLTGGVYDNQWFLVKTSNSSGKLYSIIGSTALEAILEYDINDLQDINIVSVDNGDILRYDTTTSKWINSDGLNVAEQDIVALQLRANLVEGRLDVIEPIVSTNSDDIDTLQSEMDAVEGRLDIVEPIVEQHTTDISDLDDRITFVETTGGIDFIKVATFNALPSSGDARLHRLFLTEDTKQLWEFDGTQYNESSPKNLQNITITSDDDDVVAMRVNVGGTQDEDIVSIEIEDEKQIWVEKDGKFNVLNEANLYGDLTIAGNLTVNGTTTTVNTTTLDVEDNIITINKNQTGTPETNLLSGIEVERGDETNFQFVFQESSDLFKVGQVGDLQAVATREDTPTDKGVAFFNTSTNKFETSANLKVNASGQLVDTTIRNSGVGVIPLIVNTISGTTSPIQEWQSNGTQRAYIDNDAGRFRTTAGVANRTNFNSSLIQPTDTGTNISRNIADANPSLIVNLANSSSTGNITNFQFAGANKLEITRDGFLNQNGTRLFFNSGTQNTFFGALSGNLTLTGTENSGYGNSSLTGITSGSSNSALGTDSLRSNTTGSENSAFGRSSLFTSTTANNNSAFGRNSGRTITTGSDNTFVGHSSGFTGAWGTQLATATNSTAIGYQAYTDASNQMVFGNASVTQYLFGRGNNSKIIINGSTTTDDTSFDLNGATINTYPFRATRRGSLTDNRGAVASFVHQLTSGQMIDGFGSTISFAVRDADLTDNFIGQVGTLRSGSDNSGRLTLYTSNAGTLTEKMTILPDGKVGIGTSAPARLLSLVTSTNDNGLQIRRNSLTTNDYATLSFRIADTDNEANYAEIRGVRTNRAVSTDSDIAFATRSNNVVSERMRIRDDGLVGIGTTTPNTRLHVLGTIRSQGTTGTSSPELQLLSAGFWTWKIRGDGNNLNFSNDDNVRLNLNNSGLVGINETTPTAQLQVKSGATNRIPLNVDALTGHTEVLQSWRVNGVLLSWIESDGSFRVENIRNKTSANNSAISLLNTGTTISRNIADTNPALIVNLANAGATGNIVNFQKAGSNLLTIGNDGSISNPTATNSILKLLSTGTRIERNVNDANTVLRVEQLNGSATGYLLELYQAATEKFQVDIDGDTYNTNGTYGTISDIRVKENILPARNYTEDLMKLQVVKYSLKYEKAKEPTHIGFIAQDFEKVFPKMVATSKRGDIQDFKSIKTSVLIPMLVKVIQELNERIEELEKK